MHDLFTELQSQILEPHSNQLIAECRIDSDELQKIPTEDRWKTLSLCRLASALKQYEFGRSLTAEAGTGDLAILMRQIISAYGRPLKLSRELWLDIAVSGQEAGLYLVDDDGAHVTIRANPWQPQWLPDYILANHRHENRRAVTKEPGDGLLVAATNGKYTYYQSAGQKRAVDAVMNAPAGSTTLITLPTGGGKSMCVLLPAWFVSQGGRNVGGTTLVIVPTVSLALDQEINARRYFQEAVGSTYKPQALTGDTTAEERAEIYEGLDQGTLPLLFTSPEALLNGRVLHEKIRLAASRGYLNWLVIDEAHVIETWGTEFRTEFQLLSTFRRKLLDLSSGQLRTLLLSATVSEDCEEILAHLFAEDANWQWLRAEQLRPEPAYWFHVAPNNQIREQRVIEALHNLPRPAILYVTRPSDATEWTQRLNEKGFRRIAAFSGDTAAIERRSILREWLRNERDLIVATSAFGLGVDKPDVRTIIHATMPESQDRFYQEVGRGGRDGFSSTSLVCVTEDDYETARSLTKATHIGPKKAWSRWSVLWNESVAISGDERFVNLDTVPAYMDGKAPSQRHRDWNEHLLLLMQRAKMLEIHDTLPPDASEDAEAQSGEFMPRDRIRVKVLREEVTTDAKGFESVFKPIRQNERQRITQSQRDLRQLIEKYASSKGVEEASHCIAHQFRALYPHATLACGGCAFCRQHARKPYVQSIYVEQDLLEWEPWPSTVASTFDKHVTAVYGGELHYDTLLSLLVLLVTAGYGQLIIAETAMPQKEWWHDLGGALAYQSRRRQRLITDQELIAGWQIASAPTVIVFPHDRLSADSLHRHIKQTLDQSIPRVYVVKRDLYLISEQGLFTDRVNGLKRSVKEMLRDLKTDQTTI